MITTLHYIGENVHTLCGETFIKVFKKFNDSHLFILRQICIMYIILIIPLKTTKSLSSVYFT